VAESATRTAPAKKIARGVHDPIPFSSAQGTRDHCTLTFSVRFPQEIHKSGVTRASRPPLGKTDVAFGNNPSRRRQIGAVRAAPECSLVLETGLRPGGGRDARRYVGETTRCFCPFGAPHGTFLRRPAWAAAREDWRSSDEIPRRYLPPACSFWAPLACPPRRPIRSVKASRRRQSGPAQGFAQDAPGRPISPHRTPEQSLHRLLVEVTRSVKEGTSYAAYRPKVVWGDLDNLIKAPIPSITRTGMARLKIANGTGPIDQKSNSTTASPRLRPKPPSNLRSAAHGFRARTKWRSPPARRWNGKPAWWARWMDCDQDYQPGADD